MFCLSLYLKLIISAVLGVLIFAPVLIRFLEKNGYEGLAVALSWIGYIWMAFIVLFFFFGLSVDFVRLFIYLIEKSRIFDFSLIFRGGFSFLSGKANFLLPLFLSILFVIYGLIEASQIKIERVSIKTDKVSKDLRIVQISDVHLGLLIGERKLKRIANHINELSPDILVSTGDLVDGQIENLTRLSDILRNIETKYGKYAVTGNHEFYRMINQSLSFMTKAGFTVLRNQGVFIEELNLNIIGVDDIEAERFGQRPKISESELLRKFQNGGFVLFLKHRPIVDSNSRKLFDLQLSGHTHKGQFFPFTLVTAFYYERHAGCLFEFDGCYLYTSRGTGTWGPPIRIFAPPEITLIEIQRKN